MDGLILAVATGILPPLVWLWFWLSQDTGHPRNGSLLFSCFALGMIAVMVVLPAERFVERLLPYGSPSSKLVVWAAIEEIAKYLAMLAVVVPRRHVRDTVDFAMYMITVALGFAALENVFYLLRPELVGDAVTSLLAGNLRFLGATLLHASASALVGIALGLAWWRGHGRNAMLFFGLGFAVSLHAIFNFLIMKNIGQNFLPTFGFLWATAIIIILLFEKLRRMNAA